MMAHRNRRAVILEAERERERERHEAVGGVREKRKKK
jgi:hypothetical protein